jgi:hypothetical protein
MATRKPSAKRQRTDGADDKKEKLPYVPSAADFLRDEPGYENLTYADLAPDLNTSYVGKFPEPPSASRPPRQTWPQLPPNKPVTDPKDLPLDKGWSILEKDIDDK